MNLDYFTRLQCCAFRTLFEILSGPLPEIRHPRYAAVSQERAQLWHLLDGTLQVSRRSLIEIKPSFTKVRRGEDAGIATCSATFLLRLETKVGRVNIPPANPPQVEVSITMQMVMDVPEWSVHTVKVGAISGETAIPLVPNAQKFAIFAEPV